MLAVRSKATFSLVDYGITLDSTLTEQSSLNPAADQQTMSFIALDTAAAPNSWPQVRPLAYIPPRASNLPTPLRGNQLATPEALHGFS